MRLFLDTSAYAKRFIEEQGSTDLEEIISGVDELGLSVICIPELFSAMSRRLREKSISKSQYSEIKIIFSEEIKDIDIVQLTDSVLQNTIKLLEKHILRTLDAIQIASAVEWKADAFITSDKRQINAAKGMIANVYFV